MYDSIYIKCIAKSPETRGSLTAAWSWGRNGNQLEAGIKDLTQDENGLKLDCGDSHATC